MASILGVLALVFGVSAAFALLFFLPRWCHRLLFAAMVFSTSWIQKPFYQEVMFQNYRGAERGFGVTIPDILFLAFFLYQWTGGSRGRLKLWPYNTGPWLLIVLISAASVFVSAMPLYSLFTVHKLLRCLILYWVVVNFVREEEDVRVVVKAFVAAALLQGAVVFYSKYISQTAVHRVIGTFNHPNGLAMYLNVVLPVILATLLVGARSRTLNILSALAVLAGVACVLFTKSRAAVVLLPMSLMGVSVLSLWRRPTQRKLWILSTAAAVACVVGVLAAPRIVRRFETAPEESARTREYFNDAAVSMANSGFFGVGINMFSHMLEHSDHYWLVYPDYADHPDPEFFRSSALGRSRLGTAHHIYYLFAAEIGWVGMGVFVLFVLRFYLRNIVLLLRERNPFHRAVLLGALAGISTLHLQGLLEWFFRVTDAMYLFFIVSGVVVAIGEMQKRQSQRPTGIGQGLLELVSDSLGNQRGREQPDALSETGHSRD